MTPGGASNLTGDAIGAACLFIILFVGLSWADNLDHHNSKGTKHADFSEISATYAD